ncbi:MAG: YraN family protein [Prevotellaceae bacterium]|jgi:putative endonuclease|nr:YraN family protein [Prevotellaceae bacterium]
MTDKQITGENGEQIAKDYLVANGFTIRQTNWRQGHKELDIIAEKNNHIHIIEVRSLSSGFFQQPYQSIGKIKQRNLIAAADAYIQRYHLMQEVQIDVISIVFYGKEHVLEYIPNAVYPTA